MSLSSKLPILLGFFAGFAAANSAVAPKPVGSLNSTPIYFEPNQGQFDSAVRFLARGAKYQAWITDSSLILDLAKDQAPVKIQFGPQTAAKRHVEGLEKQPGTSSYFKGSDSSKWITGVPSYSKARLADVYPGIDIVFYGRNDTREIEYDFVVKPGADPSQISIDFDPKLKPVQGRMGEVTMDLPGGKLRHEIPSVHLRGGKRVDYTTRFDGNRLRFQFGQYDTQETLIVDPGVVWSTYISGYLGDGATGVALDPQGNTYVTGKTKTANFPLSNFADSAGASENDAVYVAKIGATPGAGGLYPRLYSAYFGGAVTVSGIAVDPTGAAYITGASAAGFPTRNAFQPNVGGLSDVFVTKISATPGNAGHTIVYSSFIGGPLTEDGGAIAVDSAGAAYVTGRTQAGSGFPTLNNGVPAPGPFTGPIGSVHTDVFVVKVAATPSNNGIYDRVYSVLYGGGYFDTSTAIAVDAAGAAYITGSTLSENIPLVQAVGTLRASNNAFVAKIGGAPVSGLYQLVYSTYLGGSGDDAGRGIAVDSTGTAYIAGSTTSTDFPTRLPLQSTMRGGGDAFVTTISGSAPHTIQFSTYWGGDDFDQASSISLSGPGKAFIAGTTQSGRVISDFPIVDPSILAGSFGQHAFAARFSIDATAARTEYSTHLDRSGNTQATSIAVDAAGSAVVAGSTLASDFPVVNGVGSKEQAPPGAFIPVTPGFGFAVRLGSAVGSGSVIVTSNATGRKFTTSGAGCNAGEYTAPQLFAWPAGTSCTVTFEDVFETSNTRFNFKSWSDDNSTNRVRTIVSNGAQRVFTAVYEESFALSLTAVASGTQTVLPGLVTPGTKTFYKAGTVVPITALSNSNWTFAFWSIYADKFYAPSTTVKMEGPRDISATFDPVPAQRGTALQFVPITPCRIADTRLGTGATPIAARTTRDFTVAGTCNIPVGAQAYALNVTVVPKGPLGYLTLWPKGKTQPVVSTLNSLDGRVKANAAVVPAGTGGAVSAYVTDAADVVIDINGFFMPPGALTLQYFPMEPCRIIDTRTLPGPGPGRRGGTTSTIFPQGSVTCRIPESAKAYMLNVAVVPSTTLGYLTLWPGGAARPLASTLNATTGTVVANAAIVAAGDSGTIQSFVTDDTEMILDITGYFAPANSGPGGMNFYAVDPCRLWDSRPNSPLFNGQQAIMRTDLTPGCTLPATARVASLNVTVIPSPSLGYLTLWGVAAQPVVSTLNALDGAITSNAAFVDVFLSGFNLFGNGNAHFVLDVNGYFATY